jgi:pyridoxal 5'-phosphate synthase pdxS subunit
VDATTYWKDPRKLAEASRGLGAAMPGLEMAALAEGERMAARGW